MDSFNKEWSRNVNRHLEKSVEIQRTVKMKQMTLLIEGLSLTRLTEVSTSVL